MSVSLGQIEKWRSLAQSRHGYLRTAALNRSVATLHRDLPRTREAFAACIEQDAGLDIVGELWSSFALLLQQNGIEVAAEQPPVTAGSPVPPSQTPPRTAEGRFSTMVLGVHSGPDRPAPEPGEPAAEDSSDPGAVDPAGFRSGSDDWLDEPDLAEPISARARGDAARISWPEVAPSRAVTLYRVVQNLERAPESVEDGEVVAARRDAAVIIAVPPGGFAYYAVYRYSGTDEQHAKRSEPALHAVGRLLGEVSNLALRGLDDSIAGTWTLPAGAVGAWVARGASAPSSTADPSPELLTGATGDYFEDFEVAPGATYYYRVGARYLDGNAEVRTSGVVASATISRPLGVIDDLRCELGDVRPDGTGGRVRLTWSTPGAEVCQVFTARTAPQERLAGAEGELGALVDLGLGVPVRTRIEIGDGTATATVPFDPPGGGSVVFVTVVTSQGPRLRAGLTRVVFRVPPTRRLSIRELVDYQLISWDWTADVDGALIEYLDARGLVTGEDELDTVAYRASFGLRRRLPDGTTGVRVTPVRVFANQRWTGNSTTTGYRQQVRVSYTVERDGILGRRRRLRVYADRGESIPPFALVHSPGRLPIGREAREFPRLVTVEVDTPAAAAGTVLAEHTFVRPPGGVLRLFLFDHRDNHFVVDDPPLSQLKD